MNNIYSTFSGVLPLILLLLIICMISIVCLYHRKLHNVRLLTTKDPVTGGYSREGFLRSCSASFEKQNTQYAVVVMEVLNFRHLRQTFGISDSERFLAYQYRILKSCLSNAEPVARLHDGTFCLLLKTRQEPAIRARLQRIDELTNNFNAGLPIACRIDLRFGISLPIHTETDLQEMLEQAAGAVPYTSTVSPLHFCKEEAIAADRRKWEQLNQMIHALQNGEFVVYMQPKVRLGDKRIIGAEALIRWKHPQRGMLTPEMFLPLLEEYRQIHRFDMFLFETVCKKLSEWKKAGWNPCPISVNMSERYPSTETFLSACEELIRKYDISPDLIEFELDTNALPDSMDDLHALIDSIRSRGFLCALDHFGDRDIDLYLLRDLEINTIKLDRDLFTSQNNSRRNRYVVEAVLKLASQLQIHTVAEGIDNASQVQYLQQVGCDMIQGFFYFRPMSVEDFQKTAFRDGTLQYVTTAVTAEPAHIHSAATSLPAARQNITMFSLLPGEDKITFSNLFSPMLNGQPAFSNAMSLFTHSDLIHENDRSDFFNLLERCRKESGWVEDAVRFYTSEGRYEWLEVHLHKETIRSQSGSHIAISGTLVNMAEWKNEVKRWKDKANRDALTGLYNREYFEHYTDNLLEKKSLTNGALIFIDVDDFKKVNDTLGHMVGDDVLCFISKNLLGAFRHSDTVARYAGDEFIAFINGISRSDLEKRLEQLVENFRFPYRGESVEYKVSISIGVALYPSDGCSYQELLNRADSAAYTAKHNGKNQFIFYKPGMEGTIPADK